MVFNKYTQVLSLLLLIASIYYSFYVLVPNDSFGKNPTLYEFSTSKAMHHVKMMSKKPHFTGSVAHSEVQNYIKKELEKMGLQVEIQEQFAINKKWKAATTTQNILAKIKGSGKGKSLVLLSHYDSNPHSSLGASDAASGVAVILESVRVFLQNNKQPKNDIIICITDAEELGLLGAKAFVKHHKWAKNVGLVLNFEARGSGGPSYMLLETNGGNATLIKEFQKANPEFPVGNSLLYSIYKMLPNDTDLTVFREEANIDGFNFAFIDDHFDYHTVQDSYERLNISSLNHQATYLQALLPYFANNSLSNLKNTNDFVYFNFPYIGTFFYPFSWVIPLLVVCIGIFLFLIIYGFKKNKLTLLGIAKGFVPLILSTVLTGIITYYGWLFILKVHPEYSDILHGFTYNGKLYIIGFVSLSIVLSLWLYKGFIKKRSSQDLQIAPLVFWMVINAILAFKLQGAGFFILIVFVSLLLLFVSLTFKQKPLLFFTVVSIPILLVFVPFIKTFPVGLGLKILFVSSIFSVLLIGFLLPILIEYKHLGKLNYLIFLIGIISLGAAEYESGYSIDKKKPNSILYVQDATTGNAYWASFNSKTDNFTKQFLGNSPVLGSFDNNTNASKYKTPIQLHRKTKSIGLKKPYVKIISDTLGTKSTKVCIRIQSNRNANRFEILAKKPIKIYSFSVNNTSFFKEIEGNEYSIQQGTLLNYYVTKENEWIDIELIIPFGQKIDLDILEAKFDLLSNPQFKITPRSNTMMPMPFVMNDATVIKTNLKF